MDDVKRGQSQMGPTESRQNRPRMWLKVDLTNWFRSEVEQKRTVMVTKNNICTLGAQLQKPKYVLESVLNVLFLR